MDNGYLNKLPAIISIPFIVLILFLLVGLTGCAITTNHNSGGGQAYIDDHEYLSAYGNWINYPPYGEVWMPNAVPGWEPFYYGHWIWTVDGWTWTSYEPYGWLVFHYGNWNYKRGAGWFWIPGDVWWPARVQWYTFGNYTAWAPLPPPGIVWHDPWTPYDFNVWFVVNINNFTYENVGRHRIKGPLSSYKGHQKNFVKRAPDFRRVEKISNRNIQRVRIRERETNIQPRTRSKVSTGTSSRERVLKKIVLPKPEKLKVNRNSTRVERKVLTPAKKDSRKTNKSSDNKTRTKRKTR